MHTQDMGNNESISRGLRETPQGYLALTYSQSKWFVRRSAAVKWLAKRGVNPDGSRIA